MSDHEPTLAEQVAAAVHRAASTPAPRKAPRRTTVRLDLTPAQARLVNSALAREEAEEHEPEDGYSQRLMDRTRAKVHDALEAAGVEL